MLLHLLMAGFGTFETSTDVRLTAAFWVKTDVSAAAYASRGPRADQPLGASQALAPVPRNTQRAARSPLGACGRALPSPRANLVPDRRVPTSPLPAKALENRGVIRLGSTFTGADDRLH